MSKDKVIVALKAAWEREIEAAKLYKVLAEQQNDSDKKSILLRLAEVEQDHARQFADRILEVGGIPPMGDTNPTSAQRILAKSLGTDAMLRKIEAEEKKNAHQFASHAKALKEDVESMELFLKIEKEEEEHSEILAHLKPEESPNTRLEAMLKGEKWHASTGSWIGDAIYGLNDGLGAVFGVVSGMAGAAATAPNGARVVLVAGLIATMASALSMGSSAFMASKSEREVYEAEIAREKREIEEYPEHEKEELQLIYQLKGFSESEATAMSERISTVPEQFLQTMVQEELGLSQKNFPNPISGAFTAAAATAIGGIIPVAPFLLWSGTRAVIAAAIVGMGAHFAVGAGKSMITARKWWTSGMEMTLVGFLTGGITYLLGLLLHIG